jgi:hypothetical protein
MYTCDSPAFSPGFSCAARRAHSKEQKAAAAAGWVRRPKAGGPRGDGNSPSRAAVLHARFGPPRFMPGGPPVWQPFINQVVAVCSQTRRNRRSSRQSQGRADGVTPGGLSSCRSKLAAPTHPPSYGRFFLTLAGAPMRWPGFPSNLTARISRTHQRASH